MKARLCILGLLLLAGCATQDSATNKYAVLRLGDSDRIQISIEGRYWTPLFTIHGFGGYRRALYCWSTLNGIGPDYKDPVLHVNQPYLPNKHVGVISVDRKKKSVTIKLDQVVPDSPKRGIGGVDPEARNGPSPQNGTYRIKRIVKEEFIKPE